MAIERFEEALNQYITEETQKMKEESVQTLEGHLTEESVKAAARLLEHRELMASTIKGRLRRAMNDISVLLEDEGYDPPPATILGPGTFENELAKYTQDHSNAVETYSEDEASLIEFSPRYAFPKDLFEISDEDFNYYEKFIGPAINEGGTLTLYGQKPDDFSKQKFINAGIRFNRRVITLDSNSTTRPKGTLSFKVSEALPHLTFDNINLLRDDLGNIEAFKHLQPELGEILIDNLDLNNRTKHCLKRAQIMYVEQILRDNEDHLADVRNFGQTGFQDLLIVLTANKVIPEVKI